uniref:Integrase catalytic domain-containing protein n=1 Tax=Fagus sylvatica TaxID=28930 RepID=A0A2N9H0B8_FAGSY
MTKSHPIRSLLQRPVLSGRLAQWLLQLSQYEIIAETPTAIRSQVIADLLAQFPGEDNSSILDEVPGEINEVFLAGLADSVWTLKFDGSSTTTSAGAAEYEAYLDGLAIAYEMGIKHLRVIGDSNLVDCQARGEFSLKEPSLAPYRALAQKLEAKFNTFEIEHAQRNENRYADALATLGSQIAFEGEEIDVTICKKARPITESLREKFEELPLDQEDWRAPIKAKLISPAVMADLREIKDYTLISGDLYRRLPGGVLARCISIEEAKEKLPEVHEKTCGDGGAISLYRRLQRLGYFWPNMSAEAAEIQSQCPTCQFHYSNEEDVYRLKRLALRYFVEGGTLFRKGFHGEPLRCLSLSESQMVMKETHAGECGEHQGKKRLYQCLLTLGYYWPTMKKDAADFVKTCHTCQVQANLIHTHPTSLQNMATPWPFHTWGLDLIGPINPASGGYIWILVATEYFTKWVEAIPLRRATGAAVANFIREHIITRFGIPYKLITDNGTPFINKDVREVLEHYRVKHRRSTPYYPQGNGQAEATNRMLLRILSKMVFDYGNNWKAHLADVLWAYRSSPKTATGFTPFSLEEPSLVPIRTLIQKLEDKFNTFEIDHAQRIEEPLCGPPRGALARCIIIQRAENKSLKICEHTRDIGGRTCPYSRLQWLECFNPI